MKVGINILRGFEERLHTRCAAINPLRQACQGTATPASAHSAGALQRSCAGSPCPWCRGRICGAGVFEEQLPVGLQRCNQPHGPTREAAVRDFAQVQDKHSARGVRAYAGGPGLNHVRIPQVTLCCIARISPGTCPRHRAPACVFGPLQPTVYVQRPISCHAC